MGALRDVITHLLTSNATGLARPERPARDRGTGHRLPSGAASRTMPCRDATVQTGSCEAPPPARGGDDSPATARPGRSRPVRRKGLCERARKHEDRSLVDETRKRGHVGRQAPVTSGVTRGQGRAGLGPRTGERPPGEARRPHVGRLRHIGPAETFDFQAYRLGNRDARDIGSPTRPRPGEALAPPRGHSGRRRADRDHVMRSTAGKHPGARAPLRRRRRAPA